jgi:hypothetical protein
MSLCGFSVFSVPLWFDWVGGNPKSEIRNPKSEMDGRAAFLIPNFQFLIRAVATTYSPGEPNVAT